ncbi:hypothetical protein ACNE9Y_30020 [Pseudomonas sp. NY11226]|uniref:hypothetical protein n=1 Tax=Pseudomonas sp. NY11226 TaxID=3400362 RepID=UPI003A8BCEA4
MELLLIVLLWFIIISNNKPKPTSDQTRSELIGTKKENMNKIGKLEYALHDANVKVNEERVKFSNIQNNPDKPFRLDRSINRLTNVGWIIIVAFSVLIWTIPFIDPAYMPQWINNFLQENTALFELLKGIILLHLTATAIFIVTPYIFVTTIIRIIGVEQNCKTKLTPIERFVEGKRDELESLERRYDEYVKEKTRMLEDLKIRNIEIDELIKQKENLIKND